jgi:hypothetical protein
VPLVLLEAHRRTLPPDASRNAGQPGDERRRLQAQAQLVPVVLAVDGGAGHTGADLDAQDQAGLSDPARLLRGVRVREAGRQGAGDGQGAGDRARRGQADSHGPFCTERGWFTPAN